MEDPKRREAWNIEDETGQPDGSKMEQVSFVEREDTSWARGMKAEVKARGRERKRTYKCHHQNWGT